MNRKIRSYRGKKNVFIERMAAKQAYQSGLNELAARYRRRERQDFWLGVISLASFLYFVIDLTIAAFRAL